MAISVSIPVSIIVSSDRAHSGAYQDKSGPAASAWLSEHEYKVDSVHIVPDEREALARAVLNQVELKTPLIIISGGTGLGPRDVTPQVLDELCDYNIPGFGEMLRFQSLKYSLNAYLSRCGGWVKNRCLILALPGNPKAVVEQLTILEDLLPHALKALSGTCENRRSTGATP
jgi:molybdenum cofactor synthesis domain-containing protein